MTENVALTPEEQRRLKPLFEKYDLEDSSIVLGDRVRPLLEHSGLPSAQLRQIWQLVDVENRGFLDFQGFAKCMRLIAHAQQGLQLSPRLANIPSGPPDFSRAPATLASPQTTGANFNGQLHSPPAPAAPMLVQNSTGGVPPLTTPDKQQFGALFDRSVPPNSAEPQFIDGSDARTIFLKAKLPEETLAQIWALVDVDGRGKLTKNEFVVAMHLIQAKLTGALPVLPPRLPNFWQPWLGSPSHGRQGSIQAQPGAGGTFAATASSPTAGSAPTPNIPTGTTAPTAPSAPSVPSAPNTKKVASLVINPQERAQYDAIFDSLDPQGRGILGPQEAVPVLTKSGLSEDTLARVWDLADTRSRGQLDRGDFALAMHFVKAKLNGMELPDAVQPGAGEATHPAAQPSVQSPPQPKQPGLQSPPLQPASSGVPPPPAKPVQRAATSSLSDLVSLDNAVFQPPEPAKPRRAQTEFVPATSFGQQLLNKQPVSPQTGSSVSPAVGTPAVSTPAVGTPSVGAPASTASGPQAPSDAEITAQKAAAARANEELAAVLKRKEEHEQRVKELRTTYDNEAKKVHETQQSVKREQETVKQLERDLALRTSGLTAMRTQQEQEQRELDGLLEQRHGIEEQLSSTENELNVLKSAIDSFDSNRQQQQNAIKELESKLEKTQSETSTLRQRQQDAQRESEQLEQQLKEIRTQTEKVEAELAGEREKLAAEEKRIADARRTLEEAQRKHSAAQAALQSAQQQTQAAQAKAKTETDSANAAVANTERQMRSLQLPSSPSDKLAAAQSSAAQLSAQLAQPEPLSRDNSMPSFVLPMARPASISSSVVNNPPQSASDLDGRDSFEFVDANDHPSSGDDEGPEDAVPRKYDAPPPMPGAFPTTGVPVNSISEERIDVPRTQSTPVPNAPGATAPGAPAPGATRGPAAPGVPSAPGAPTASSGVPSAIPSSASSAGAPSSAPSAGSASTVPATRSAAPGNDDFENFDDLEEAKEDETEISQVQEQQEEQLFSPMQPPINQQQFLSTQQSGQFQQQFLSTQQSGQFQQQFLSTQQSGQQFQQQPIGQQQSGQQQFSELFNQHAPVHPPSYPQAVKPASVPDEWQQLFASPPAPKPFSVGDVQASDVAELTNMGFSAEAATDALRKHKNNLSEATNYLLDRAQ